MYTKTRVKPPPAKIMVKREVEKKLTLWEEENDTVRFDDDDEEEDERSTSMFLTRTRRNAKIPGHIEEYPLSPVSVTNAANYDEKENNGWVKPIFSSIVYRLPVSLRIIAILTRDVILKFEINENQIRRMSARIRNTTKYRYRYMISYYINVFMCIKSISYRFYIDKYIYYTL